MENLRNQPIEEFYNNLALLYKDKPLNEHGYATAIKRINDTPIHYDDYVALMFVLSGSFDVKVSFNQYKLRAGDFLLINPYELHRMVPTTEDNAVLLLKIDHNKFQNNLFAFDYGYYNQTDSPNVVKVKEMMVNLYISENSGTNDSKSILEGIINIVDERFQMHEFDVINQKQTIEKSNNANLNRIKNAYEILYFQYGEKIRLKDFADAEHIDSFYASRIFKKIAGNSFQDSLNLIRIDRAELFLLGTDLPIQTISDELGFSSYDYFNKNFKMAFGKTASGFRKENKPLAYPNKDMDTETLNIDARQLKSMVSRLELGRTNKNRIQSNKDYETDSEKTTLITEILDDIFEIASTMSGNNKDGQVTLKNKDKEYTLIIKE